MHKKLTALSVFFPLYNEEQNVKPLVEKALEVIPRFAQEFEIILINDGSTDKTLDIATKLVQNHPNIKIISQKNSGYGGALKTGFAQARYDWIFYSDGDLQFDLTELAQFVERVGSADLIIGYRKKRAEGFKRVLITKLLKIWNKIFFNFPDSIKDIDCAFKLLKREVIEKVLPLQSNGGLISTELLLKAHNKGFKIVQIPVTHKKRLYGKSTGDSAGVIKKALKETLQLLNIFPQQRNFLLLNCAWSAMALLLLPVAFQINYMQNDEYTHYRLVAQFLQGDFKLDSYLGATFYAQGFLGMFFAVLFGMDALPVLTLLLSIGTVWLLSLILYQHFNMRAVVAFLAGLFILVNPLFLYSTWGFMTENYFMFFFVMSLWSYFSFAQRPSKAKFALTNILFFLSYGVRQFGLFTPLAAALDLFVKRQFKWAFAQFALFLFFVAFHAFIFPQTPQMYDGRLSLANLTDIDGAVTRVYIFGIYLTVFLAPFVILFILATLKKQPKLVFLFAFVPLLFWFCEKKFEPENIHFTLRTREGGTATEIISPEFPYLRNIFTRKGFYEDNLPGDKYIFPGYFDLFNAMELTGKILFVALVIFALTNLAKLEKVALFYSVIFAAVLLVSPRLIDRYLLPLIITTLIMLMPVLKTYTGKTAVAAVTLVLLFWAFLGYQFSTDFILVNRYIWQKAQTLADTQNIPRSKVSADHSWRQLYPNRSKDRIYHFTYADFDRAKAGSNYSLVSKYRINYPLNFYKEPFVFLYYNSGAVAD